MSEVMELAVNFSGHAVTCQDTFLTVVSLCSAIHVRYEFSLSTFWAHFPAPFNDDVEPETWGYMLVTSCFISLHKNINLYNFLVVLV
jgi:hypothetical protein